MTSLAEDLYAVKYDNVIRNLPLTRPGEKTRVAFVLPKLHTGGAERVLITLMNGLDRDKFAPELITVKEGSDLQEWIANDIPLRALNQKQLRASLPKLLREIKSIQPHVVMSTMAHMNFALLMLRPALRHTRMIVREAVVPSSIIDNNRYGQPWMVREAYRRLYPNADLVLSPAQCIIDEFKNNLKMDTGSFQLLHNPVDITRMRGNLGRLPLREAGKVRFVAAGRLHKQKGYDQLLNHLSAMRHGNWSLDIFGKGEEEAALRAQIASLGLQEKVFLKGESDTVWREIAAADCLVMPSRWEGLPNAVLESLALGTPVIATASSGGIQEIAAMTPKKALNVVQDMSDFVNVMNGVSPGSAPGAGKSLLPTHFHLDRVSARFESLLKGVEAAASDLPQNGKYLARAV